MTPTLATQDRAEQTTDMTAIRPFQINIPEAELTDLHRRVAAARMPDKEMPLIVSHGWPGSVVEQLKLIEPLTNPTAHGGTAADAFHVIIPSMPGYGFSSKPTSAGWGPERIARTWDVLNEKARVSKLRRAGR